MLTDIQGARDLAESILRRYENECGIKLAIDDGLITSFNAGWIFYWNTEASIKFGDLEDPIGGNAPIVVFKDGSVRQAPTAYSKAESILKWLAEHPEQGAADH